MAKKVKLDILESEIDQEIGVVPPEDVHPEADGFGAPLDPSSNEGMAVKFRVWTRKPLFWIAVVSVVLTGLLAGAFVGLRFEPTAKAKTKSGVAKKATANSPLAAEGKYIDLKGLVVDQKDEKGNIKLVFCDLSLELDKPQATGGIGERADVRDLVHATLKRRKAEETLSPEGRSRLKAELTEGINALLGGAKITGIYFTRCEMN